MDRKELKYIITAMQPGYVLLDVRSKKDYHVVGHIITTLGADVTAAENGDDATALKNLKKTLADVDDGAHFVLLDDGRGVLAAHAARLLGELGISVAQIETLEGGYAGWLADDTDGRYQRLIDVTEEAEDNTFTPALFLNQRPGEGHIAPAALKEAIEKAEADAYYILDSRTVQEFEEGHFPGSVPAPTFAFYDDAGFVSRAQAIANVEAAFAHRPYTAGTKLILVCRGGRGGAQLLADVLYEAFGIDSSMVYILTYGYDVFPDSWMNLGDDYTRHIVTGALN